MADYDGPGGELKKSSLRGKVFQKIRDDILSGRYQQGDELIEAAIGGELGVSLSLIHI